MYIIGKKSPPKTYDLKMYLENLDQLIASGLKKGMIII